jgi:tRNA(fMet)-specific endonuclease VapC
MTTQYLLDTNIVGYFLKGAHPRLHQRMERAMKEENIFLSVITRAEIRYGQALMASDDKRHRRVELFLGNVPTLAWTLAAANVYGPVKARLKQQGTPIGELDTQIAAHALAENFILVTHNTRHFEKIPNLKLENWVS